MAAILDVEGRILDVSDVWAARMGYSREELSGRRPIELASAPSARRIREQYIPRYRETGRLERLAIEFVTREGAGFEVYDLGINNSAESYLEALEKHNADILGMSALLTTTMPYMKVVVDTLKEKGMRDDYIVLVGGAPLNEEFGAAVGADAYCRDAAVAAETAKELVMRRRLARAEPPGPSVRA